MMKKGNAEEKIEKKKMKTQEEKLKNVASILKRNGKRRK